MAEQVEILGISAVTVFTANMARAVAFYDALGFERLYGDAQASFTSYAAGPCYINIAAGTPAAGLWGRSIVYVGDVDAMYRRVRAAGYEPEMAPSNAPWGERYFHVRDPDGNELSFARPLVDAGADTARH